MKSLGFWAFILGLILAIVFGLFFTTIPQWIVIVLLILGLIIGFLNVTGTETVSFLVAAIALIIVGGVFSSITVLNIGDKLDNVLALVAALMAPAAIVVAIKALWSTAKS